MMTAPAPLATLQEGPAFRMLDEMQRGFPLTHQPFHVLSQRYGLPVKDVMDAYHTWLASGALSRVGGVFDQAAGGASLLAAMAVPADDLQRVAAIVSQHPGVNHNYEREHAYNLWFVMTGPDTDAVTSAMRALDHATGYTALRLPMVKPYRIDLSFGLSGSTAQHDTTRQARTPMATITDHERPLAALVEEGLAITEEPFGVWADALGLSAQEVLDCLERWLDSGVLRRFGNVVRHHEFGFHANAMTVFDISDDRVDAIGEALARMPEVTLAYQRSRAPGWSYNLYCMIHGKDRDTVHAIIERLLDAHGLRDIPHAVLFSVHRFKQSGARRYRDGQPRPNLSSEDITLIDRLHGGFPLSERPYREVGKALGLTETQVIDKLKALLAKGVLTRFGPLFQIERAGGQFVLAAIAVPEHRFDEVAGIVNGFEEVAHNYRRDHKLNMWFVVAAESAAAAQDVMTRIEQACGLKVYAFPKEREFFVELRLPLQEKAA